MINVVILPNRDVLLVPDGADEVKVRFTAQGRATINDSIRFQADVKIMLASSS